MLLWVLTSCGGVPGGSCVVEEPASDALRADNIVVILLDDLGADKVGAYGLHPRPAPTPNLDALAARGTMFTAAYAEPLCSPSRAALLTGRRPVRTGIGANVEVRPPELSHEEVTLPEALALLGGGQWTSMAVGKWHLSNRDDDAPFEPLEHGFDHFDGLVGNPGAGDSPGWYDWEHVVDGDVTRATEYITTSQADAAIAAVQELPEPFFLYVAFSGAHGPLHDPPPELVEVADPIDDAGVGDAMIEATDHELGRLLDAIGDSATVLVMGDNGTSGDIARPPTDPERSKGSPYPGGTQVPLLVAGPGVPVGVHEGLVHITDLFPTVLELTGHDAGDLPVELDGASLVPALLGGDGHRTCAVVERFKPNGDPEDAGYAAAAAFDEDFWLVRPDAGGEELYRRVPAGTPMAHDLLDEPALDAEAEAALRRLRALLDGA